jgi:hypothetical protein
MERELVESGTFNSVGYDPVLLILELEFKVGAVYQYFNVSEDVYRDFKSAPSLGQYFNLKIKPHYQYQQIKN